MNNVLVVGSIGLDDVKTSTAEHKELLGGSASFAAVAAALFGPVRLVGIVGRDFPEAYSKMFASKGIDLAGLEIVDGKTFRWSGEYEVDMNNRHTRSIELNVFETFSPKIPGAYRNTEFILLANIAPSLQSRVLEQVASPKFIVADTMDLWINIAKDDLTQLIKKVNMLILNDSEAKAFTGQTNAIKAGRELLKHGMQYVIVKKGEHGSVLLSKDRVFVLPAMPLEDVFDPTGAGDSFVGALVGYCAQKNDTGWDTLQEALVQATLVASFNVESFSLKRLEALTPAEISARRKEFLAAMGR